ncbi:hypothetical protein ACI2IP_05215 [Microbacterium sp. NPDC090218]
MRLPGTGARLDSAGLHVEHPRHAEAVGEHAESGDLEAADWRIFRLDRMHPRIPIGPSFSPRPLPAADAQTFAEASSASSA